MQQQGTLFYYSSSILYFLSGLAVCILPLIPVDEARLPVSIFSKSLPFLLGLFFLFMIGYHIFMLNDIYHSVSIDVRWADMLPTINAGCKRFLSGKTVYGPMPEIFPKSFMPYLPMMWMPFLPAVVWGFDLRWMTFIFQFAGLLFVIIPIWQYTKRSPVIPVLIAGTGLFLLHNYFLYDNTTYWSMTEEGVVVCYFLILSVALLRQNFWLTGFAITCCCLSRYSLALWLPVYFCFVLLSRSKTDITKLFLSFGISMLALFILPFFIKDPMYFIRIPYAYTYGIGNFWRWSMLTIHQYYMVGFFKFFTVEQLHIMFILQVCTAFAAPLVYMLTIQWLKKRVPVRERYIAWGSLKISLIFFFGFIQEPYQYIFVPVTIISYAVLFDYLTRQNPPMSDLKAVS